MAAGDIAGSLVSAGTAAATGNYVSAGLSVLGIGAQLLGGNEQANIQKQISAASKDKVIQEGLINDQKQQAMELSARRSQIKIIRNTQRARAMGQQAAVSQGAQFGSGYQGGQAQAQNQGAFNLLGVNNNLEIGENIFAINKNITADNAKIAGLGGDMADAQSLGNIGSMLSKSADPLSRLSGQLYPSAQPIAPTLGLDGLSAIR